jgi:hypothetical protein
MKGRNVKQVTLRGGTRGRGRLNEEGKGGWIWLCIFYTRMSMEHWNLLKSLWEGEWGRRENNGKGEPNWGVISVYMEMSQQNSLNNS